MFTLTFKKPQTKHKMSIKNYDNLFEYDSNVLPCSQTFVSYRINLHTSSCLKKKKKKKKKKGKKQKKGAEHRLFRLSP